VLTRQQALAAVSAKLLAMSSPENPFVVVDKHTIEKPFGWVFFYNSKKFLETGLFRDGLVGNGPIIINRDTGSIEFLSSGVLPSHSIAKYEERLAAEQRSPDLAQIAEHLCGLKLDPSATLHHELMSDALVWSDELPKGRPAKEVWALRPVLRYGQRLPQVKR
jgi:hypothetical protein